MKSKTLKRGYVLLFSVLTAAMVLGVAAFIVSMARKQFILSTTARESLISFYNADSAMNCIENSWDHSMTDTSIICNNIPVNLDSNLDFRPNIDLPSGSTAFSESNFIQRGVYKAAGWIPFASNGGCARFYIWIGLTDSTENPSSPKYGQIKTVIETLGYNNCTGNAPTQSSRTVERAIRISWEADPVGYDELEWFTNP
jgi:hypothetical protein